MQFAADCSAILEVFVLISVELDMGSLGSTDIVQTIFELLSCSMEHVRMSAAISGYGTSDHQVH
jgi:hypothetical protein